MKVFVFLVAILLAAAVHASPLSVDDEEKVEEILSNDIEKDPEVKDKFEPIQMFDNDANESDAAADESISLSSVEQEENEVREDYEPSQEDGVPYEDEGKSEDDGSRELSIEEYEREFGKDIPMCDRYTNQNVPLHLSHLTECGKFYKCYNGRGYLMDCPAGEHWSVRFNRCDYPGIAGCKLDGTHQYRIKRTKPVQASMQQEDDDDKPIADFEIDPRCEGSDPFKPLHFKHVSDCTKFYKCYMGKAYVIKCPKSQQWAQHLNRCEHPQLARCSITKPAEIKPAQAFEESEEEYYYDDDLPIFIEEPDFRIDDARCIPNETDINHPIQFSHPTDCGAFYKCFDHKAYKTKCPAGLHFNQKDQSCDYPMFAKCKVGIMQASETLNLHSIPKCPEGNAQEKFAVDGSFNRYFSCVNGFAYLMECEPEELFNPISKQCEKFVMPQFPGMMMPPPNMMSNYPNPMMPQYPVMPQYPGMNQQYPGMNQQYPGMNQFPDMNQFPQFPGMNQNPQPMAPKPQQPQNPDFPSWMPIPNPNIPLPDLPRPQEKPSHEKPTDKNEFNYQSGKPNSRCPSTDNPSKPQHLAHENECTKFYKCFDGRAFLMECPETQEWSDELQRCDFHQFANCDPVELIKKKIQA